MKKLFILLTLAIFSIPAQAGVYKCKSKYGKLILQDTPCNQDVKAPEVNVRTQEDIKKLIKSKKQEADKAADAES